MNRPIENEGIFSKKLKNNSIVKSFWKKLKENVLLLIYNTKHLDDYITKLYNCYLNNNVVMLLCLASLHLSVSNSLEAMT